MMVCPCGSDEFVEQRLVRPAGRPRPDQGHPMSVRSLPRYRYVCANTECGTEWGETPPQQRKRGRQPRAKTN